MFDFQINSDECIKCGKCIPSCTIHFANPDEVTSPRGFIALLGEYQQGNLELDREVKNIFESCFLCTNCVDVCPKSLPTDTLIENIRSEIAEKYGIAWFKRFFFFLLRNRTIMDIFFKFGYMFQSCGVKIKENINSITLPIIKRTVPSLSKKSFLNSYPEFIDNGSDRTVAIFIGCLANYNYTNIGKSLLAILRSIDYNVFLAKEQLCCGAPAYFTGDFATVDYLSKRNIEYFETFIDKVEAILIPEATCSGMVRVDYSHYFHNQPEWRERIEKLSDKIFLATEWLYRQEKLHRLLEERGKIFDEVVTYHDPCHARKMQGVYREPRELIQKSYKFREMENPNQCCGFGGVTIQSEKYHLAKVVGDSKAEMVRETNSDIVSAECSACRVQITDSLERNGVNTIFRHPVELIADALFK
ncbi:MAG TPA: (Fe-S)-binding protein [Campylobacterales bacterium]|nr:(Fe-S)-binding protein [Campylobacterales bacterium]